MSGKIFLHKVASFVFVVMIGFAVSANECGKVSGNDLSSSSSGVNIPYGTNNNPLYGDNTNDGIVDTSHACSGSGTGGDLSAGNMICSINLANVGEDHLFIEYRGVGSADIVSDGNSIGTVTSSSDSIQTAIYPVSSQTGVLNLSINLTAGTVKIGSIGTYSATGTNLIQNHSFETHGDMSWVVNGEFTTLEGWIPETSVQLHNTASGINPSDGGTMMELDVMDNQAVSQNLALAANQAYVLAFDYNCRNANFAQSSTILVEWNSVQIADITEDIPQWGRYYLAVKGSASSVLRFTAGGLSDGEGGLLDNISLVSLNLVRDGFTQ